MRGMKGTSSTRALINTCELDTYSIVVHSHLRWDWVWQRPQQFLSRLSRRHKVLFVEAPDFVEDADVTHADLRDVSDCPNVHILQIKIPATGRSDTQWIDKERRRVVQSLLSGP